MSARLLLPSLLFHVSAAMASRQSTAENLLRLGAPRAARRLGLGVAQRERVAFAVDDSLIVDVADEASARAFAAAIQDAREIAFDCEWQPDGPDEDHAPSLAQVAVRSGRAWLLDLEVEAVATVALDALGAALWSDECAVLGFGAQADLDKLAAFPCMRRGARRLVDLERSGSGLRDAVVSWTEGFTVDKAMQCSAWERRPLTRAQRAYAAADAAVLYVLADALKEAGRSAEERTAAPRSKAPAAPPGAAERSSKTEEAAARARARAAAVGGRVVAAAEADGVEVNALCVVAGKDRLLVVFPADAQIDWKWFALATGYARRQLRLASWAQCVDDFGAAPGRVPPVPLRDGVRTLAHPTLVDAPRLVGSAGDADARLELSGEALRGLCDAVLPDPSRFLGDLDAGLDRFRATKAVTLDNSLQACARKLRMIGVDAAVAGEVLDDRVKLTPRGNRKGGLDRVRVDATRIDADLKEAALEGRVLVVPPRRAVAGAHYVVRARGGDAQFDELLDVLDLRGSVPYWGSRCGICNGNDWVVLSSADVEGRVPDAVLSEAEFYRCGKCQQIFWPGRKYDAKMSGLRDLALNDGDGDDAPARDPKFYVGGLRSS